MPGYSGRKEIDNYNEYNLECNRLNALLKQEYDRYYFERKEKGIVEKYNADRINVETLIIDDFLSYDLNPQLILELIEFYIKYRPTYTPTLLELGKIPKETVELLLAKSPDSIKMFNKSSVENYDIKSYVISHSDSFIYGDLPVVLSADPEVKEAFNKKDQVYRYDGRDINGYDENWLNKEGKLKEWFSFSTGYIPKSKDDYMEFFYKYIAADTTVNGFCSQYGITSTDDFSKFLDRVGIENAKNETLIKNQAKKSSDRFWISVVELSKGLSKGEIQLEDFLKNNKSDDIHIGMILDCMKRLCGVDYKETEHAMAEKMRDYITNNEYTLNIEGLSKLFKANYISSKKSQKGSDLTDSIKSFLMRAGYLYDKLTPAREYYKAIDIVSSYNTKYNPNTDNLFNSMNVNGKQVEVTKEHMEQLQAYIKMNDLPKTRNIAYHYLIEIVSGRIDYSEETNNLKIEKAESTKVLQEGIEACNGAQDYFVFIDKFKKDKLKKGLK